VTRTSGAFVLDVEGTTTPLHFVTRILFPYARERVGAFVAARGDDPALRDIVQGFREERSADVAAGREPPVLEGDGPDGITAYARWLMDQDRKATPLKTLQGLIWEEGFRAGHLRGQVYDDVPPAFARWKAAGQTLAIFSSGSVLAQRLLFGNSDHGDLGPFLDAYFDTTTGPKREARSYLEIARALHTAPERVLFVSDVAAELDAARAAGLETALCVREGPLPSANAHTAIRTFDDLD
jgi:enolase-phosphatase E1